MRSYTVTITPDDGVGAQTVVKLHVDGATPRITKLELTAPIGQTLATSQLPAINLEMLLASVQPTTTPHPAPTPAAAVTDQPAAATDIPTTHKHQTSPNTDPTKPAATTAPKTKPATATKTEPATAKTATSTRTARTAPTGRAYRTLPADFPTVYQQSATVGAVADHYDVPRHTAQNWVVTARRRDLIPAGHSRKDASPAVASPAVASAAADNGHRLFLAPTSP